MAYLCHCPLLVYSRTITWLDLQYSVLIPWRSLCCPVRRTILFNKGLVPSGSLSSPSTMAPVLPQELVDNIIDIVASRERNTQMRDLKSCSLAARSLSSRSQRYILESITIPSFDDLLKWTSEVDPTSGILSHVRMITLCDNFTHRSSPDILTRLEHHLDVFDHLECLNLKEFRLHSGTQHNEPIPKWPGRSGNALKTLNLESCSVSPNAFQSILHLFPFLDNVSISDDCHAVIDTESDRALMRYPGDGTNFRGSLVIGINTLQEFLPCLLMAPLQFHRLVCVFNGEGHQIVSACAPTLQILNFEGNPVSCPWVS